MFLDLHTHSTASDGQYRPDEIIQMAVNLELEAIAITDHDTVDGIAEARKAARSLGMNFIPGIEISTQLEEEIHVLGYFIDEKNEQLRSACQEFMDSRLGRGNRIAEYLRYRGVAVDLEEIKSLAGEGSLGRPHFARYLQDHGYVRTRQEAFLRYLDTPEFHRQTDRIKPTPQEAIRLIHGAGGKAVIAHPGLLKMGKHWQESLFKSLREEGLDGIEAYYGKHTSAQIKYYRNLATELGLKVSCGSDFHGEKVKPTVKLGMIFPDEYRGMLIKE